MNLVDPVGDMLTRIRNGQMRSLKKISIPFSKFRLKILEVIKKEGFIVDYFQEENELKIKSVKVLLKYYEGQPVIREIKRVSKPGRRVYSKIKDLQRHFDGLGIYILSTSKGVLSDSEARVESVGGEILCKIF